MEDTSRLGISIVQWCCILQMTKCLRLNNVVKLKRVEDDLNDSSNKNKQNDNGNRGCKYKTARKKAKEKRTVSFKH